MTIETAFNTFKTYGKGGLFLGSGLGATGFDCLGRAGWIVGRITNGASHRHASTRQLRPSGDSRCGAAHGANVAGV
ncbi:MAG: hypothetical protein WAU15_04940 [Nitrosomonas sp.]